MSSGKLSQTLNKEISQQYWMSSILKGNYRLEGIIQLQLPGSPHSVFIKIFFTQKSIFLLILRRSLSSFWLILSAKDTFVHDFILPYIQVGFLSFKQRCWLICVFCSGAQLCIISEYYYMSEKLNGTLQMVRFMTEWVLLKEVSVHI